MNAKEVMDQFGNEASPQLMKKYTDFFLWLFCQPDERRWYSWLEAWEEYNECSSSKIIKEDPYEKVAI